MNADELQRTLDSIPGFFPGDIKIEQPRSLAQDLEDLYSDPEVSGIRVQDWHSGSEPVEGLRDVYWLTRDLTGNN